MALDSSSISFTTWTDAEIANEVRFGQSKFERMAQNQIAFDNRLNNQGNAWSLGDDFYAHMSRPPDYTNTTASTGFSNHVGTFKHYPSAVFVRNTGTDEIQSTAGSHVWAINFGGGSNGRNGGIQVLNAFQPDVAGVVMVARVYNDTYSSAHTAFVGLTNESLDITTTNTTLVADTGTLTCAAFIRGTTTGTWDAVTYQGGTERTRTASLSGTNYTSWDRLKVEVDDTSARFYVHDGSSWVLKATHTTQIAAIAATALWGLVLGHRYTADGIVYVDELSVAALANSEAP